MRSSKTQDCKVVSLFPSYFPLAHNAPQQQHLLFTIKSNHQLEAEVFSILGLVQNFLAFTNSRLVKFSFPVKLLPSKFLTVEWIRKNNTIYSLSLSI